MTREEELAEIVKKLVMNWIFYCSPSARRNVTLKELDDLQKHVLAHLGEGREQKCPREHAGLDVAMMTAMSGQRALPNPNLGQDVAALCFGYERQLDAQAAAHEGEIARLEREAVFMLGTTPDQQADRDRLTCVRADPCAYDHTCANHRLLASHQARLVRLNEDAAAHAASVLEIQGRMVKVEQALRGLLALIDDGQLVRNITNDGHFPSYMSESVRLVNALHAAHDALAELASPPSGTP